jgi:hypothetical protein
VADNTRKSHNKNHYQAMLDDTNNIYFYRIRSRDAAGIYTENIKMRSLLGKHASTPIMLSESMLILFTIN